MTTKCPILVVTLMVLLTLPATLQAQFNFTTNNGTITITGYDSSDGNMVIPSMTNGFPVTDIGDYALGMLPHVTNVLIPSSITNIGSHAFSGDHLRHVTIPGSVHSVGTRAFGNCDQLASVTIGNGVNLLGDELFYSCMNLALVTIPDSVTSIGSEAFAFCFGLTNLTLGKGLTNLGDYAFQASGLQTAFYTGNAPHAGLSIYFMNSATNYYLPGTTNWGATFGDRPTALWRPQMLTRDTSFGVHTNQFGFNIAWSGGMNIAVDACTDLANPAWLPLQTNTLPADTFYYSDPDWTNSPRRYYRVRWPGPTAP